MVGVDYKVCQNQELAEFTDALAQSGKVVVESCGSIRGGKRVWFLARGEAFDVGGVDEVFPYLLVSNGHDHQQAIRVTPTTIRVVCDNTLHMVIPRVEGQQMETAAIAIRHSGKISEKMEQAKLALKHYGETLKANRELFEKMQGQQIDRKTARALFASSYASFWNAATKDDMKSKDERIKKIADRRMERMQECAAAFLERYDEEKRSLKLGDTLWGAFNAMTGFVQHTKTARGANNRERVARRMEQNLFGVNAKRTHEVLSQALALAV